MKNREKYRDEIFNSVFGGNVEAYCEFAKKNVLPNLTDCTKGECDEVSSCTLCQTIFSFWLDEEYEEHKVDWNNVPVDTLVRVKDEKEDVWALRYFSEWVENGDFGMYRTFPHGTTSKTTTYNYSEYWVYCELVEDEDE